MVNGFYSTSSLSYHIVDAALSYSARLPHEKNDRGEFPEPPILAFQPSIRQPENQTLVQENVVLAVHSSMNCSSGLEYLKMVDQLLVQQKIDLLGALTGFASKNKYHIRNTLGQDVYFAAEDSDCCTRNCYGQCRPFDMKIFDNFKNEVIHLYRPLACDACCFPCCLESMEVFAPPGIPAGTVQQEWSIFYPTFAVKNASGDTVLRIEGPLFTDSCGSDVTFRITSADGTNELGKITKQWSGCIREAFTNADDYGITFPIDLDVKIKAVLLGGLFLIDVMFYEDFDK